MMMRIFLTRYHLTNGLQTIYDISLKLLFSNITLNVIPHLLPVHGPIPVPTCDLVFINP